MNSIVCARTNFYTDAFISLVQIHLNNIVTEIICLTLFPVSLFIDDGTFYARVTKSDSNIMLKHNYTLKAMKIKSLYSGN